MWVIQGWANALAVGETAMANGAESRGTQMSTSCKSVCSIMIPCHEHKGHKQSRTLTLHEAFRQPRGQVLPVFSSMLCDRLDGLLPDAGTTLTHTSTV